MPDVHQICVVSGKGGTGKTTVAAMSVTELDHVLLADADVDAPNLHILLNPKIIDEIPFVGSKKAHINNNLCTKCGICYSLCRFGAISKIGDDYHVDDVKCSGCSLCYHACREGAIEMKDIISGKIFTTETKHCYLIHAILNPGEENSGKLVAEVRKIAKDFAKKIGVNKIVLDGAPGIGCPVIASLSGVDLAVVVAEPTLSGLSDMARILELTEHFKINSVVIINKFNLNKDVTGKIEKFCESKKVKIVAKVPYDEQIIIQTAKLSFPFKGKAADEIRKGWKIISDIIKS